MIPQFSNSQASRILFWRTGKHVSTGLKIVEGHIEMGAAPSLICERLRHERRQKTLLGGVMLGHITEEGVPIAHRQSVSVFEVKLELRISVLVIKRIKIPTQIVNCGRHLIEPVVAIHEPLRSEEHTSELQSRQ